MQEYNLKLTPAIPPRHQPTLLYLSSSDKARFPMTYCLLSTATAIDVWEAEIGTSDMREEAIVA